MMNSPAGSRPVRALLMALAALVAAGTVLYGAPTLAESMPLPTAPLHAEVTANVTDLVLGVSDDAGDPAKSPTGLGGLVALPRDAATADVVLKSGIADRVSISRIMTMRGRPVAIVQAEGVRSREIQLEIHHDGNWSADSASHRLDSPQLAAALGATLPAASANKLRASGSRGSYVIVHAPEFVDAIAPLADWKQRKGMPVVTVSTDEIGASTDAIKGYLQDAYDHWEYPPEYILLVGDINTIPNYTFEGTASELAYCLLDGDDFLPDAMLGRFPVENDTQARTLINKTIAYERTPYVEDPTWITRSLMVAGLTGSTTPPHTLHFCGEQLESMGFTQAPAITSPVPLPPLMGAQMIKQHVDAGVSILAYRGWAYGSAGWDPPVYTVDNVPALENGPMMPVVFSFVCLTGDFTASTPCLGEVFVRQGSPDTPENGAIAFIGNGEHWSHTRYNDALALSTFERITDPGLNTLGSLLTAGKLRFADYFPHQIDAATYQEESVEFYFHIYNLLGDPELNYWRGAPIAIDVDAPTTIALGQNTLEVTVSETQGKGPIAGVRVGVVQDGKLLGSAYTDEGGLAYVVLEAFDSEDPVDVTVSGASVIPRELTLNTDPVGGFLAVTGGEITAESGGYADGSANPGESVDLAISFENTGNATSTPATVTGVIVRGPAVCSGSLELSAMASGDQAQDAPGLSLQIAADAADGEVVTLELTADHGGGVVDVNAWETRVRAPALQTISFGPESGFVQPGQLNTLQLSLRNNGSLGTAGGTADLQLIGQDGATLSDGAGTFGACEPGAQVTSGADFTLSVDPETAVGTVLNFTVLLTSDEGQITNTSCAVVVGDVDLTAPSGPDGYGYYAYDSADLDYPASRPVYDWLEISTAFDGPGTELDFSMPDNLGTAVQVDLPFDFRYYGQLYNRIRVSDNGWISFDLGTNYNFYNWVLPSKHGNDALVAPFWDNLTTQDLVGEVTNPNGIDPDGIYVYHDTDRQAFIIEWSRLQHLKPEILGLQTFQAVLLDPAAHPTATGDGEILFQYRRVANNDYLRNYATVGWEDPLGTDGLQLTYSNTYCPGAAPVHSGLAIRMTTEPPVRVPFAVETFTARSEAGNVHLAWTPADERPVLGWHVDRTDASGTLRLTESPLPSGAREFVDTAPSPDPDAYYSLQAYHPWQKTSSPGETRITGSGTTRLALSAARPNPTPGQTRLGFALPRSGTVRLRVYDVAGRLVRTLLDGRVESGQDFVTWDGRDEAGSAVAGGVYFYRLEAETGVVTRKLTLVR